MRIAIINQFYTPDLSATAHLSASLAEDRAARGDVVTVVTGRGGYTGGILNEQPAVTRNPRVYRVWTSTLGKATLVHRCLDYLSFYLMALWRMMILPRQDVVVSLTTPPFIAWTGLVHKLMHPSAKLVLWNMDSYPEAVERIGMMKMGGVGSRIMRAMNRALFRRLDQVVGLDAAMNELLRSQYAPPGRKLEMTVIPNWEKASFFPRVAKIEPWAEAETLGLRGRFVILYLGNTGHIHQFETVLEAAHELREEPVAFLFVGGGARWEAIRQSVSERGLKNVVLRSYVPKELTPQVMGTASCALITLQDWAAGVTSPSKLHSNLAMGLPVIYVGAPASNVDEAIAHYGCGVSVRSGDVRTLVDFVRSLMGNAERLKAMRDVARYAFEDAYCDTRTLAQFEIVFRRLYEGSRRAMGSD